ncbi:hypothetical protein [Vibrio splendidus]|uniref:hypothetical protein n=1 Tax=Vibrio splendidus TaxID=29497 RepID=UPI003D0568C2
MGKLTQRMSTFLLPTSMRLAWLNLLRNGRRSLLSVLIIAIAVFALTSRPEVTGFIPTNL